MKADVLGVSGSMVIDSRKPGGGYEGSRASQGSMFRGNRSFQGTCQASKG